MGRRVTEFSTMIRMMQVGQWVYLNSEHETGKARWAARYVGHKLQILKTTAGRWRAERVA